MIDRQEIDEQDIYITIFFSKKKRNRIDIPLDVYVSFIISRFFFISFYLLSLKKNGERKSRWILSPISNTHSYLLIERSSSNTGLCLFFRNSSYPRQLTTSTPPHTTSWGGGCSPFESNKVSSRGFIATFILKETEEPTFSQ